MPRNSQSAKGSSNTPAATKRQTGRALQQRRAVYLRANPLCKHCEAKGLTRAAMQVDHIVPLFKGGVDDFDTNGQGLCVECHAAKTARDKGQAERPKFDASGRVEW